MKFEVTPTQLTDRMVRVTSAADLKTIGWTKLSVERENRRILVFRPSGSSDETIYPGAHPLRIIADGYNQGYSYSATRPESAFCWYSFLQQDEGRPGLIVRSKNLTSKCHVIDLVTGKKIVVAKQLILAYPVVNVADSWKRCYCHKAWVSRMEQRLKETQDGTYGVDNLTPNPSVPQHTDCIGMNMSDNPKSEVVDAIARWSENAIGGGGVVGWNEYPQPEDKPKRRYRV